jgi:membrane associated rhomboid family serine protease
MAAKLAIALLVGSIIFKLGALELVLVPAAVVERLHLWQPVSYVFVAQDLIGLIFGVLITWQLGGALEMTWGPRRLLVFAVGTTVIAGVLTVLAGLAVPRIWSLPFGGGTVMTTALWIAYGLSMGRGQTNFWGIPLTGNTLALIGVAFIVLGGVYGGFYGVLPDVFGAALTWGYVRGGRPRVLWLRFQSWRLQRQLRGRSKHLRVVGRDGQGTPNGSDRYLN